MTKIDSQTIQSKQKRVASSGLSSGNGLLLLLCFFLLSGHILQAQRHQHYEMVRSKKKLFLSEKLLLTDTESPTFWRLYNEYEEKKRTLHFERRALMSSMDPTTTNISDDELHKKMAEWIELEEKKVTLIREYHNKFLTILPPHKVALIYLSEEQFKRHLMHQIRDREE